MTPQTMRRVRQYHLYAGVFFAPLIILFALSGALQTFRLQEEKGWGSEPPAWIVTIASIHRDSKLPAVKAPEAAHDSPAKAPAPVKPKPPQVNKLPMQVFMVAMSIGLLLSACLGIAIALNNKLTRRLSVIMLVAGSIVPILLLQAA